MDAIIRRRPSAPTGTPGNLRTANGFSCDTLELPWRDNRRGESCINADTYMGWIWQSPSMGRAVIRLEDKHGRRDCLIHNGNFAGDTLLDIDGDGQAGDLDTQVHGCTLVGMGYGWVRRRDGEMQWGVLSSKDTLAKLIEHIGPGLHSFTYIWGPGCEP